MYVICCVYFSLKRFDFSFFMYEKPIKATSQHRVSFTRSVLWKMPVHEAGLDELLCHMVTGFYTSNLWTLHGQKTSVKLYI